MGRSIKKGPYVDQKLLLKIEAMNSAGDVEYWRDGTNGRTLFKNSNPGKTENTDITKDVAGQERFWVRCWYRSSPKNSVAAVYSVEVTGEIK